MSQKVVMTGTLGVMTESNLQVMKELLERKLPGAEFQFLFDAPQDDKTLIAAAKGASVMITQYQFLSDAVYDALAPELKAVVAFGIGYNSANLSAATAHGVYVCNVLYFHFYLSPFFSISFFIIAYLSWIARLFSEFGYCPERFLHGFLSAVFRRHA